MLHLQTSGLTLGNILVGLERGVYKEEDKFESDTGKHIKVVDKGGLTVVNDTNFGDNVVLSVVNQKWYQTNKEETKDKVEPKKMTGNELIQLIESRGLGDFEIELTEVTTSEEGWGYGLEKYTLDGLADIGYSDNKFILDITKQNTGR